MTYSIYDGPTIFAAAADPAQAPQPSPFGPFRRKRRVPQAPASARPGFGLLAVDPETFSSGRRRLKLRHAAMATGAFAMLTVGAASNPPVQEGATRAAGLADPQPDTQPPNDDAVVPAAEDDDTAGSAVSAEDPTDEAGKATKSKAKGDRSATAQDKSKKAAGDKGKTQAKKPWRAAPIAEFQGLTIKEISDAIKLVGFHEAAYNVALPMTPTDPPTANHGAGKVPHHSQGHERAADLLILPTRLRDTAPNTAMDIAVEAGAPIYAPVDGEVTAVHHYELYGKYPDTRIEIRPAGRPDLQLTVLHVSHPFVKVGDQLVAGETPFAGHATLFPFESQIDRFSATLTGSAHPHVHMEFKYR